MSYVIDANSLLKVVRELGGDAVEVLEGESTLSLAPYEVGNGLWKECSLLDELDSEEASEILDFVGSMMEHMEVISVRKARLLEKALQTASEENITYYDSAYLTVAEREDKILVTEDGDLQKTAEESDVEVLTAAQMLEDHQLG